VISTDDDGVRPDVPPVVWQPDPDGAAGSRVGEFLGWLQRERGLSVDSYDELWRWSVDALKDFWDAVWQFLGVPASAGYTSVLSSRDMPGARWFEGARLNYAEAVLEGAPGDELASLPLPEAVRGALAQAMPLIWNSDQGSHFTSPQYLAILQAADILKVNDAEATLFTGVEHPRTALDMRGNEETLVLITLGADGCLWRYRDGSGEIAAPPVRVVDTTGAGDAFVGALLARLCALPSVGPGLAGAGDVLSDVLRFAAAAGALTCTRTGAMASLPTVTEVERLLAAHSAN